MYDAVPMNMIFNSHPTFLSASSSTEISSETWKSRSPSSSFASFTNISTTLRFYLAHGQNKSAQCEHCEHFLHENVVDDYRVKLHISWKIRPKKTTKRAMLGSNHLSLSLSLSLSRHVILDGAYVCRNMAEMGEPTILICDNNLDMIPDPSRSKISSFV